MPVVLHTIIRIDTAIQILLVNISFYLQKFSLEEDFIDENEMSLNTDDLTLILLTWRIW